ncbi:MAG TPA: macro domain-containing protein [Thermoanaerobaculia bacterium]|nr:macro domain-containing protein [Thermoanaerobaculia bacterium]
MADPSITRWTAAEGGVFEIVINDLLAEPVDCIVNAANGMLSHGGGVAAAIAGAAGHALVREGDRIVRERGPIPVGEVAVTTAGDLPFKGVIHAVGPRLGDGEEQEKIERALRASFRVAEERGWTSLSFPAISSGIFAVPLEVCARAYVRAVSAYLGRAEPGSLRLIRLCLFQGPMVELVKRELDHLGSG